MRKIVNKNLVIFSLILVLCISLFLGYKTLNNKKDVPERYKTNNERKQFAMFIKNNENNQYETYEGDSFPEGYRANLDKSLCTDINGNIVKDVISNSENGITVTSNKTVYCEIYLDEKPLTGDNITTKPDIPNIVKTEIAEDELEYRYQGTFDVVNNNYICLGTKDKDECVNSEDRFMYWIIGVTKNKKQFKVIKKAALEEGYYWHNVYLEDIQWPDSDLYKGLNGLSGGTYNNLFIGNTEYIPNNDWLNKIDIVNWKYGDYNVPSEPNSIISIEQAWTNTTSARIGLMNVSDFSFSMNKEGLLCSMVVDSCKNSWIQWNSNDLTPPTTYAEWTMIKWGNSFGGSRYAFTIMHSGCMATSAGGSGEFTSIHSVRPVFYLIPEVELSGTGTIDDPYIIVN